MKYILVIFSLICTLIASAQKYQLFYESGEELPYEMQIQEIKVKDNVSVVNVIIQQKAMFSYNVSFEDIYVIVSDDNKKIMGELISWNGAKRGLKYPKPIDNKAPDKFSLQFDNVNLKSYDKFIINIGTILNRQKTPITMVARKKSKFRIIQDKLYDM